MAATGCEALTNYFAKQGLGGKKCNEAGAP